MSAFVEHEFKRGFLLDEIRFRKLHEVIAARVTKLDAAGLVKYKVFRGDSYSYETQSIDDVINEDNEDWRAITQLQVLSDIPNVFSFKLLFVGSAPKLTITGEDRDAVFLVFSDVRDYINNDVLANRALTKDAARVATLVFMVLVMIGFTVSTLRHVTGDPALAAAALKTDDLRAKLDFLIGQRTRSDHDFGASIGWMLALLGMMVLALVDGLERLWRFLFPANLFLFGKRKLTFERRQRIVTNVFWVIVVGTLVSMFAGFIVWRLTKN